MVFRRIVLKCLLYLIGGLQLGLCPLYLLDLADRSSQEMEDDAFDDNGLYE